MKIETFTLRSNDTAGTSGLWRTEYLSRAFLGECPRRYT